jgi:hypothetical protein
MDTLPYMNFEKQKNLNSTSIFKHINCNSNPSIGLIIPSGGNFLNYLNWNGMLTKY